MAKEPPSPIDFGTLPGVEEIDDQAAELMWEAVEALHSLGLDADALVRMLLRTAALEAGKLYSREECDELADLFRGYAEGIALHHKRWP